MRETKRGWAEQPSTRDVLDAAIRHRRAVGVELQRRGHLVSMAAPPNLAWFLAFGGITAVGFGPDSGAQMESDFVQNFWQIHALPSIVRRGRTHVTQGWAEMSKT